MIELLKTHPYDKFTHAGVTILAVWLFGPAWGFSAVAGFYAREQHAADRYMNGDWRSFFPWLWKWKPQVNKPTAEDTQWDFYVAVIAYWMMLWLEYEGVIELGVVL